MSDILATLYASAPADEPIIHTVEIRSESGTPFYVCSGDQDFEATLETAETVTFLGRQIDVTLPGEDASGNQRIDFAVENVVEIAQPYVEASIEAGEAIQLTLRKYRLADPSAPLEPPITLPVAGGTFSKSRLQMPARVNNWLDRGWPRLRYTVDQFPGVKYVGS